MLVSVAREMTVVAVDHCQALRLIALVLLVIAATATGFVLTRVDSSRDAWLVFGTGLALAALTGVLVLTRRWHQHAMPEVERYFTLAPPRAEGGCTTS